MAFVYIVMILSVLGWGVSLLFSEKDVSHHGNIKLSKAVEEILPKDRVSILHFFSSWCVHCRTEYGMMMDLKAQTDLPIIGVAYKDTQEQLVPWLDHMGNLFDEVLYDPKAKMSYEMGVTSIPQTFVVDASGKVIYSQKESMNERSYKKLLTFIDALNEKTS